MHATLPRIDMLRRMVTESRRPYRKIGLRFGDCRVDLRTNSAALVATLRQYFAPFLIDDGVPAITVTAIEMDPPELGLPLADWPRDIGKSGRKDAFCDVPGGRMIRKVRTGMQFLVAPDMHIAFGPCLANPNQVINFVISQYMAWMRPQGWEICHASGVRAGGRGLAIAGFSGGGKSTLALHLLSAGADLVTNDRLLIENTGVPRMAGVPKLPRVNPGTVLNNADLAPVIPAERREALARLPIDALWMLEEKYDVDVPAIFGAGRFRLDAPLSAFLVLNWKRDAVDSFALRPVDIAARRDLLAAIMKPPGPFYYPRDGRGPRTVADLEEHDYLDRLADVAVFEAVGRVDFSAATRACMTQLLGCG